MPFISTRCAAEGCTNQISPLGGFVKTGGYHYHVECYLGPRLVEAFQEGKKSTSMFGPDPTSTPRYAPGEQPKFSKEPKSEVPLTLEEWDRVADKTISRFTVNHGAMLPQVALKLYLKRLYRDFIEARLAIPLTDDIEGTQSGGTNKPGLTLDQWMKGSK